MTFRNVIGPALVLALGVGCGHSEEEWQAQLDKYNRLNGENQAAQAKLSQLTKLGLAVNIRHNRMVISLPGDVLFDSGKETLKKEGLEILAKVATVIKNDPQLLNRDYEVAGHSDNKQFKGGPFKDNWG